MLSIELRKVDITIWASDVTLPVAYSQQEVGRECGLLSSLQHVVNRAVSISAIGVLTRTVNTCGCPDARSYIPNADLSSNKQNIYPWITKH